MSRSLRNLTVGPSTLKSAAPKRGIQTRPIIDIQEQRLTQEQTLLNLPEVQPLRVIPGIEPFLIPDLISDLVDMYQYAGITKVIETFKLVDPEQTPEELSTELILTYAIRGMEGLRDSIFELDPEVDLNEIEPAFREGYIAGMTELVRQSDPANPSSIIFNHPTQRINRETERIEIDMIKNEPEVAERFDIPPCECGSRKIKSQAVQIRSGDEAWDIFNVCVTCKKSWKFR